MNTFATYETVCFPEPTDNTVAANTGIVDGICRPAKKPVFAGEEGICSGCGVATLSIDYHQLGEVTGEMAYNILVKGADPATMENHADRAEIRQAEQEGSGQSKHLSDTLLQKTLYYAVRLDDGTVLRLASVQTTMGVILLGVLQPVLLILVLAVLISALLASRLARQITKPINSIDLEDPRADETDQELFPLVSRLREQNRAAPDESLKGADFSADPQGWKSYTTEKLFRERYGDLADAYWKAICGAADEACPYLLTWEGEPIVAAYNSMSSGTTEDASNVWTGSEPYLVPVESFGDTLAPDYETTERFPVQEVAEKLQNAWPDISLGEDPAGWLKVTERSEGGYVTGMTAGDRAIHGKELRSLLGLRSSDFTVACDGASFTFTVRGYGHGVGLSQYGADYLARQGATFDEILAHYYPGATLGVIAGEAAS